MQQAAGTTTAGRQEIPRLPPHCVRPAVRDPEVNRVARALRERGLHSVCEEARCPNRSACWARRAVTFMLLGRVCTRACRFCAVETGLPSQPPDPREPEQVARAAAEFGLGHVVLTSVNRDDLPDGGAAHFAATVAAIHRANAETTVEVLTPDFQGDEEAVRRVCDASPEVYNHNVETVPRLYRTVRPGARFERSLAVLAAAKRARPNSLVKSGIMLGLGEERAEVVDVFRELRQAGVDTVTVGQYLRPSLEHLPVVRYLEPVEFEAIGDEARALGFAHVASGPLVRSSYNAENSLRRARAARQSSTSIQGQVR